MHEGNDLSWKKERKAHDVLTRAVAWLVMGAKMGFKNNSESEVCSVVVKHWCRMEFPKIKLVYEAYRLELECQIKENNNESDYDVHMVSDAVLKESFQSVLRDKLYIAGLSRLQDPSYKPFRPDREPQSRCEPLSYELLRQNRLLGLQQSGADFVIVNHDKGEIIYPSCDDDIKIKIEPESSSGGDISRQSTTPPEASRYLMKSRQQSQRRNGDEPFLLLGWRKAQQRITWVSGIVRKAFVLFSPYLPIAAARRGLLESVAGSGHTTPSLEGRVSLAMMTMAVLIRLRRFMFA